MRTFTSIILILLTIIITIPILFILTTLSLAILTYITHQGLISTMCSTLVMFHVAQILIINNIM